MFSWSTVGDWPLECVVFSVECLPEVEPGWQMLLMTLSNSWMAALSGFLFIYPLSPVSLALFPSSFPLKFYSHQSSGGWWANWPLSLVWWDASPAMGPHCPSSRRGQSPWLFWEGVGGPAPRLKLACLSSYTGTAPQSSLASPFGVPVDSNFWVWGVPRCTLCYGAPSCPSMGPGVKSHPASVLSSRGWPCPGAWFREPWGPASRTSWEALERPEPEGLSPALYKVKIRKTDHNKGTKRVWKTLSQRHRNLILQEDSFALGGERSLLAFWVEVASCLLVRMTSGLENDWGQRTAATPGVRTMELEGSLEKQL